MDLGLSGQTGLLTASSAGLGKASAEFLCEEGANVVVCGRTDERLRTAKADLEATGSGEVLTVTADVTVPDDVDRLIERTVDEFGGLDHLVVSTPDPAQDGFFDVSLEDWYDAYDKLVVSAVLATRAAQPHLATSDAGSIVFITSRSVEGVAEEYLLSSTVRRTVSGLMVSLAREFAPEIRVNSVRPGYVYTDPLSPSMQSKVDERLEGDECDPVEDVLSGIADRLALERSGTSPDVDYASALARAYNDYILDRFLDETDRLVGAALVPPQDPVAAAEEIDRLGDEPAIKTAFLSVAGIDRTYGHPAYDPIWEAARDNDLPVSFHSAGIDYPEFPFNTHKLPFLVRHTLNHGLSLQANALDIVARGVVERYPELEFGFFEGGLSWVPMAIRRLDREYMQHREEVPHLTKRPSEYIKDFYIGTHPLEVPADNRDFDRLTGLLGGTDRLLFATDWPHHDFDHLADVRKFGGEDSRRQIWGENARRFLDL